MTDTNAKIRAKGCEATGITEQIANQMFTQVGRHFMGIIEFKVEEPHGPNAEGKRRVDLILTQVEPAIDPTLDDHLRELTRTLHYNRQLDSGQPTLDGDDIEPKVADVLAAGQKFKPHPYMASTLAIDDTEHGPVCDVCGLLETAAVHNQDQQPADDEDEDDGPHAYVEGTIDGICAECEEPLADEIHNLDATAEDQADEDPCPHPGCELVAEHDGDHDPEIRTIPDPFTTPGPDPAA